MVWMSAPLVAVTAMSPVLLVTATSVRAASTAEVMVLTAMPTPTAAVPPAKEKPPVSERIVLSSDAVTVTSPGRRRSRG